MASSDLAAASIAAGANMNSTLWTNAANEEMQQQQNKWNLEQWHRNNAYNHPAAQMQRLKAAGLNPDLLYGQNAGGAMGNSASPAQGTQPIPKQPFFLDPTMFAQVSLLNSQKKNIDADTEVKLADAEGKQQDNFIRSLDVEKTRGMLDLMKQKDNSKVFEQIYDNWVEATKEEAAAHTANKAHYNAQYWESSAQIATIYLTYYGERLAETPLDEKGNKKEKLWFYDYDASDNVTGLRNSRLDNSFVGNICYGYEQQIKGQLREGNLEWVEQQFQILLKTGENIAADTRNMDKDTLLKQAQIDILAIEKEIKEHERDFQKWFNDESNKLSFLGFEFTPREWQVLAPIVYGLVGAGTDILEGIGSAVKAVGGAKGAKGVKTSGPTYKNTTIYNYGTQKR